MLVSLSTLKCKNGVFVLFNYATPLYFPLDEQYREVRFQDKLGNWKRGVFTMYPLDAKEKNWQEPVEWDDGRWLYVPSLDESKILNAMAYLFDSGNTHVFEDCNQPQLALPAFEIRNDISSEEVQNINSRIKLNLLNALFLLKSVYGNTNEVELLDKLKERAKEVLKDNGWHKD